MKKRTICRLIMLLFMMGIMGCGVKSDEDLADTEAEKNAKRQELILWTYYETEAQKKGLDKLVAGFNEAQQQYKISWEYVPMADFIRTLSFLQSGESLPDLVLADNPDIGSLIKLGMLADITDYLKETILAEEYYGEVWKSVENRERYYGVPFCCNNTAIIYNKRIFREKDLEIPTTWDAFKQAAAALTKEGSRYGFAMSAVSGEQGAFQLMPWMLAAGVGPDHMADNGCKEVFFLIDGLLKNKYMPNDCLNWSQNDLTRSFVEGRTAMIENGPWAMAELEESGMEFGVFEFPAHTSQGVVIGGEVLAAVKGKNVEGAVSFINYYNKKEVMEDICQITRNIPPKVELAETFGQKNPQYQVFVSQMEDGISRKSIKDWKKVCNALSDSLNKMFGSGESVEEIWLQYVKDIER